MKKVFLFVSVLIFATACAAPPPAAAPDTNRNSAVEPVIPAVTEADATAKEKAIWDAIKAKDYDAFAAMLANDHLEVLEDGIHDKAASVEGVKQFEPSELTFSDWKFLPLDKEAFIVSYTVAQKGKFQGKDFPLTSSRGSSAWVYRGNKWVAIYHQECPVRPAPAAPASSTAKPAASPAEQPVAATPGADAIANEKAVWDLLKSKNYDAFAAILAPDHLNVEPDGFHDKDGTVKGLSMADVSKAELSDWQTVKINDKAALVTYSLKGPGAGPGERHSTIWANRDGKWVALFHHGGTPVRKPLAPPPPPSPVASAAPKAAASPAAKASPATP